MKKRKRLLFLVAFTVAGVFAVQSVLTANESPASPLQGTSTHSIEPWTETPSPGAMTGQCTNVWAYYDAPELGTDLNMAVQALSPSATASAQVSGEECIYSDGQKVFTARATDFNIRLTVTDLRDEAAMGNWLTQVMPIILQLPREEMQGSMPGNVAFTFIKTGAEQIHLSIPVYSYLELSEGKTGIELFRYYHIPPTSPT